MREFIEVVTKIATIMLLPYRQDYLPVSFCLLNLKSDLKANELVLNNTN